MPIGEKRQALEALWRETTAKPLWLPKTFWRYLNLRRKVNLTPLRRADVKMFEPPHGLPNCRACTDICCIGKKNQVSLRLVDIATLMDIGRADLITTEDGTPKLKQDENERCLALENRRCSIHPNWPLSCARFPYSLDLDDREIFYSPRCPSIDVVKNDARVEVMVDAAIGAYNERIRDRILQTFAWDGLSRHGFAQYLVKK